MIIDLSKYKEAGFTSLVRFGGGGVPYTWVAGFFCQGPESLYNDGLICYRPLYNYSEATRESFLSPACTTPQEAIDKAYALWRGASPKKLIIKEEDVK